MRTDTPSPYFLCLYRSNRKKFFPSPNHQMAETSFSTMQSLAAQMGVSAQETHVVIPLDELMALKTLKDMASGNKNDAVLWQKYIDDSTRML